MNPISTSLKFRRTQKPLTAKLSTFWFLKRWTLGEYDTCLEALAAYIDEHDIDLESPTVLKKYISPSLRGILYKEATQKAMLKEQALSISVDDFF